MKILITNDDGIESPGLKALRDVLSAEHEIWIVAPDGDRSGRSHSITLREPVRMRKTGDRSYACGGSPADCVLYAYLGAIPVKPDFVVSGINIGPNLGTDIIYSGTAAAARQAALMGYPAAAVSSSSYNPPFHFDAAAKFILNNISLLAELWNPDHFININVPPLEGGRAEVSVTHPSKRVYTDNIVSFTAPNKDRYFFLDGELIKAEPYKNSDWAAVSSGRISISPIYLHPVNKNDDELYQNAEYRVIL